MKEHPLDPDRLVEQTLASGGKVELADLVAACVPGRTLRELARRFDVVPKGFRIDKAPLPLLAAELVGTQSPEVLDELIPALVRALGKERKPAAADTAPADADAATQQLLRLREQELAEARTEVESARQGQQRSREKEAQLSQKLQQAQEQLARQRAALEEQRGRPAPTQAGQRPDLERRLHDLQGDLESRDATIDALRSNLALRTSQLRALETERDELLALVPKGKRKKEPPPEQPKLADQFRVPHFLPSFYKSLADKDRRSIERAMQAVLLFCTEGPSYPGLEVKQLGGFDELWSLRASLKLRVYFRLQGNDVEVIALSDREDQPTLLRRLRE